jgi:hypothetical protein
MSRYSLVAPDRLQIREGGGALSLFGVPFFLAGLFLLATAGGAIPMGDAGDLGQWARPLLGLMGTVFTLVGGTLTFGRAWTTLDVTQRAVVKSWGLLVPMRERLQPLDAYDTVTIGFVEGDSDASDRFPVALKARAGADLVLASFTAYPEAPASAAEAARHLHFEIHDASTDHPVRLSAAEIDRPLQERGARTPERPVRPVASRVEVHQETSQVRIVIPNRRLSAIALGLSLVPLAIPLYIGPKLLAFFHLTRTPEAIGWTFLAFFGFLFGVLPVLTVVNGFLRSRRGATIVTASRDGVRLEARGAWRLRAIASLDGANILDVDYGTSASAVAMARQAAGHVTSPRLERIITATARWAKGRGVTVKTKQGLTTFGKDLDDDEIRYLADVVKRALVSFP